MSTIKEADPITPQSPEGFDITKSPVVRHFDTISEKLKGDEEALTALAAIANHTARVEFDSTHDTVSGILNRKGFIGAVSEQIESNQDSGKLGVFTLIDVDYFKQVNDTLGHDEGDRLLRGIAHGLVKSNSGVVGRWGGDEFAVFSVLEPEEVARVGETEAAVNQVLAILEGGEQAIETDSGWSAQPSLGLSSGHTKPFVITPELDIDAVAREADTEMYRVKNSTRSRS